LLCRGKLRFAPRNESILLPALGDALAQPACATELGSKMVASCSDFVRLSLRGRPMALDKDKIDEIRREFLDARASLRDLQRKAERGVAGVSAQLVAARSRLANARNALNRLDASDRERILREIQSD
jgi:hypothetical protein